ncbi:ABC transporter ATP-binding protein [Promicromonospora alba]|uniref:ABC transporter ATP-binding protein n=1 Tax=Promicromonospora alba TaxID=1616110 RepID=A0ABV9HS37_9MICO
MSVVLELADVSRIHGQGPTQVRALDCVDLTVREGELVAVMGPSGSGKSTLLNVAGGLDSVTSGTVLVGGRDVTAMDARRRAEVRRRDVGYVFQDLNLIPALTALENVALPLELDGMGVSAAREQAVDALDAVGLASAHRRFPEDLSGGQQQRVAIARALVGPRRLVLADEPTGALDSVTGEAVMRLLRDRVDAGAAGLLVTHDARYAAWADRTIHLRDGEIVGTDAGGYPVGPMGEPADLMEADT